MTKAFQHHVQSGSGTPGLREPSLGPASQAAGKSLSAASDSELRSDLNAGPALTPALTVGSAKAGSPASPSSPRASAPLANDAQSAESHIAEELAEELRLQHTPMPEHTFGASATDTDSEHHEHGAAPVTADVSWEQALPLHPHSEQPTRHSEPRHTGQAHHQRTPSEVRERIVLLSIALVGTAMTSMLHIQFGYGIAIAMAASATFMVVAILAHQLMLRAAEVRRLRRELSRDERASGHQPAHATDDLVQADLTKDLTKDDAATGVVSPAAVSADASTSKTTSTATDGSAWSLRPRTMDGVPTADATEVSTVETDLARIERKIRELASGVNGDVAPVRADDDQPLPDDAAAMETALRDALRGNNREGRAPAPGQEPVFGKRTAARDDAVDDQPKAAKSAAGGRSSSQLETSINALKAAASSMRTHGLPTGRTGAGHGTDSAGGSDGPISAERTSSRADDRLAMPSFSDPFALPATVERIAGSKSARRPEAAHETAREIPRETSHDAVGEPQRDVAAAPPEPAAAPAGRRTSGSLPDITIPTTAVSLRKPGASSAPAPSAPIPSASVPTAHVTRSASLRGTPSAATTSDDPFDFADVIAAALPPPNPRLAAIARALEAGRMAVTLSPIVGLESHAVSHYAIDVHLVGDDGAPLADAENDLTLGSNDLLALFDEARIRRAATLAAQMVARNKPGALLTTLSGGSLTAQPFADAVTEIGGESPAIALRLVLTFAQRDVLRFADHDWQAIADMQAFGFRFALSNVETLDANFADLASSGFLFVTASARQLIYGFGRKGTRLRPAAEACQRFAAAGLTVVATDISDAAERAKVFGFGALYGQGTLFGAPRTLPVAPWQPEGASNGGNGHGSAAA